MVATGINPDNDLVEIVEIPSHPYFVASQFHPEYASTVLNPHPLFVSFVEAAMVRSSRKTSRQLQPKAEGSTRADLNISTWGMPSSRYVSPQGTKPRSR